MVAPYMMPGPMNVGNPMMPGMAPMQNQGLASPAFNVPATPQFVDMSTAPSAGPMLPQQFGPAAAYAPMVVPQPTGQIPGMGTPAIAPQHAPSGPMGLPGDMASFSQPSAKPAAAPGAGASPEGAMSPQEQAQLDAMLAQLLGGGAGGPGGAPGGDPLAALGMPGAAKPGKPGKGPQMVQKPDGSVWEEGGNSSGGLFGKITGFAKNLISNPINLALTAGGIAVAAFAGFHTLKRFAPGMLDNIVGIFKKQAENIADYWVKDAKDIDTITGAFGSAKPQLENAVKIVEPEVRKAELDKLAATTRDAAETFARDAFEARTVYEGNPLRAAWDEVRRTQKDLFDYASTVDANDQAAMDKLKTLADDAAKALTEAQNHKPGKPA